MKVNEKITTLDDDANEITQTTKLIMKIYLFSVQNNHINFDE